MYEKIKSLNVSCPIASRKPSCADKACHIRAKKITILIRCNEPFFTLHYFLEKHCGRSDCFGCRQRRCESFNWQVIVFSWPLTEY
jgi:hypothetical protein